MSERARSAVLAFPWQGPGWLPHLPDLQVYICALGFTSQGGNCVCTEHVQASPLSSSVQGTLEGLLTFTLSSLFKNPDMARDLPARSIFQRNQV